MTSSTSAPIDSCRAKARRRTLLISAACLLVVAASATWLATRSATDARWNVVLVTFDTTRADRVGCYGYSRARTPAIDGLAREGVSYLRCYTPAPVTLPAHCSMMTGLTPLRHGVHDNGPDALAPEAETLAETLSRQGYVTAAFVGAFVLDSKFGMAQGFQHYDDELTGGEAGTQFCYAERNARLVTDAALEWLSRRADQPAFVWVHYFDPHAPYEAPGFDPTFSTQTDYDAEISFADAQMKRVVDFFDQQQDLPTLFIVAGDHGEGLGEHGEPTHGHFTYNSTLRVPLVIRFPDGRHRGTRISAASSLIDIAPSVLEWLHLPVPPDLDGQPLPVRAEKSTTDDDPPRAIYFENFFVANNYGWSPLVGVIWNDFKFIRAPRPELYNLAHDPDEETQLYQSSNEEAAQWQARCGSLISDLLTRGRFATRSAELRTSDLARLESLGYLGSRGDAVAPSLSPDSDAADPKDMVDVLNKLHVATTAMEDGRTDEAVDSLLQIATSDDPGNPRAVRMLSALIPTATKTRSRIVACLQHARSRGSRELDTDSLALLGVGLFDEQQYQASIDVLEEVVRLEPRHAIAYRYLGDAHWRMQHFPEAARNYQRAIDLIVPLEERPDWLENVRQKLRTMPKERPKAG